MTNTQDGPTPEVAWTAKLPTLIIGIILAVAGVFVWLFRKSKTAAIIGLVLIAAGISFVAYSMTIKDWCRVVDPKSQFNSDFAMEFKQCLEAKGWFEF